MDFFNGLQAYFSKLSQEEWWYVLSMIALAFILGLLIAYILRGFTVRRYRKALLLAERSRIDAEAQYQAAKAQQDKLARELAATSQSKVEALDEVEQLQRQLRQQATAHEQQVSEWNAALNNRPDQTSVLEEQAAEIARLNVLLEEARNAQQQVVVTGGTAGPVTDSTTGPLSSPLEDRIRALEDRLAQMQSATVVRPVSREGYYQPQIEHLPVEDGTDEDEPMVIRADTTESGPRESETTGETEVVVNTKPKHQVNITHIPEEDERDDLKLIQTIGPFLEEKLNDMGIFSYRQIAAWDAAEIVTMTDALGYLPGRIAADDWVGQAQNLASTIVAETLEEPPKGFRPDNLKLIDGIGPKIEAILKENEIKTLADLADKSIDDLKAMLEQAGSRYRMHDPSSWPVQARLARDGQWGELEELKAAL